MIFDEIQFELGVATPQWRCEDCARDVVAVRCSRKLVAALYKWKLSAGATGAGCRCTQAACVLRLSPLSTAGCRYMPRRGASRTSRRRVSRL